jgi:hypothetical protein
MQFDIGRETVANRLKAEGTTLRRTTLAEGDVGPGHRAIRHRAVNDQDRHHTWPTALDHLVRNEDGWRAAVRCSRAAALRPVEHLRAMRCPLVLHGERAPRTVASLLGPGTGPAGLRAGPTRRGRGLRCSLRRIGRRWRTRRLVIGHSYAPPLSLRAVVPMADDQQSRLTPYCPGSFRGMQPSSS